MKLEKRWPVEGGFVLTVAFTDADLVSVPLSRFDQAMLNESPKGIADVLLDAELIARRLEEAEAAREGEERTE